MIRPASFGYNEQTAANNHFQVRVQNQNIILQQQVLKEFDLLVELLRNHQIEVIVVDDTEEQNRPDAIFPNNWFSSGNKGITLFPMFALNRRTEKRTDVIEHIKKITGIQVINDMSAHENNSMFLEGTGSMVCDHQNKIIYACLSVRTHKELVIEYAAFTGYSSCIFSANDIEGREIYHTNVMMCIGERFAILCADAITDDSERNKVISELERTQHKLILISHDQMLSFAGNALQIKSKDGMPYLLISKTAFSSLYITQISELEKFVSLIIADVSAIEKTGGGSVRCMVAEIFT